MHKKIMIPISLRKKLFLQIEIITVSYSGMDVQPLATHKHLAFVLSSKMSCMNHIDGKIEKCNQGIGIIRRLYKDLPRFLNLSYAYILTTAMLYITSQHMIFITHIILKEPDLSSSHK